MFNKIIKNTALASAALLAVSAQAATVQLSGTITNCPSGLCTLLSGQGLAVNATFEIGSDGVFDASGMAALGSPTMEIESNDQGVLTFLAQEYASFETSHPTYGPMTIFGPNAPWTVSAAPMPSTQWGTADAVTDITVSGGVATGLLAFAGIGATSGAPIFGLFDLTNGTFDSYAWTGAPDGPLPYLAGGTFTTTTVPVPASAWLMFSALAGLVGLRAKRKTS